MIITWLGHSSFLLEDSNGFKILTDPFDTSIGYEVFKGEVDVVTISHGHFDHNYKANINSEKTRIIEDVGSFSVENVRINGTHSFHDNAQGTKRGNNIIYTIEMEGLKLCHLGDLGHILSQDQLNQIGNVDILLIPIGGNYTINAKEAYKLTNIIKSNIVIPMHYKTPDLSFPLDGLEYFIKYMKKAEGIKGTSFSISKEDIENFDEDLIILDYK